MFGLNSIVSLLVFVFFIWALVDILQSKRDGVSKLLWIIVCLVLPFIGPVLYYFIGRGQSSISR